MRRVVARQSNWISQGRSHGGRGDAHPVDLDLDRPAPRNPSLLVLENQEGNLEYFDGWFGGTIDNLERAMQACPDTIFIGHAPGFWREISADAADCPDVYPDGPVAMTGRLYGLFEKYPNLYADLSAGSGLTALKRDPEHALPFVRKFSDRLLFGRDMAAISWRSSDRSISKRLSRRSYTGRMRRAWYRHPRSTSKPNHVYTDLNRNRR